jgi:hypothetical protein
MIRHVVMFRCLQEQKHQVAAELRRLPALLPVPRAYHVGPDLGLVEGNFEFAVVADFEGLWVYRDNPEHRKIIGKFIQPIAARRAASSVRVLTRTRPRRCRQPAARPRNSSCSLEHPGVRAGPVLLAVASEVSADRGPADTEGPGNLGGALAAGTRGTGGGELVRVHHGGPPADLTLSPRGLRTGHRVRGEVLDEFWNGEAGP